MLLRLASALCSARERRSQKGCTSHQCPGAYAAVCRAARPESRVPRLSVVVLALWFRCRSPVVQLTEGLSRQSSCLGEGQRAACSADGTGFPAPAFVRSSMREGIEACDTGRRRLCL